MKTLESENDLNLNERINEFINGISFTINFNILSASFEFLKKVCPVFGVEYEDIFHEKIEVPIDNKSITKSLEFLVAYNYDFDKKEMNPHIKALISILNKVTGIDSELLKALEVPFLSAIILTAFMKIGGKDVKDFFKSVRYDLGKYDKRIKLYRHRSDKDKNKFLYSYGFDFWSIHWWRDFVIAPLRKDGFSHSELCTMDLNVLFFELNGLQGRNELENSVSWYATEENDPAGVEGTELLGPDGRPLKVTPINQEMVIKMRLEDIEDEERLEEEKLKNGNKET